MNKAESGEWRAVRKKVYGDDVPVEILKAKSPYWGLQLAAHNTRVQLGGWVRNYQGLDFVTVHDSGHMVPQYTTVAAAHLFKSALLGAANPAANSHFGFSPKRSTPGSATSDEHTVMKPLSVPTFMAPRSPSVACCSRLATSACQADQSPASGSGASASRNLGR